MLANISFRRAVARFVKEAAVPFGLVPDEQV
jgi:hypothetical protein